jgi:hypothetical protein
LKKWKRDNSERLAARRRELYRKSEKVIERQREIRRWKDNPARKRAQVLREGMRTRSKELGIPFHEKVLTVMYLTKWIERSPHCECCGVALDLERKWNQQKNNQSPSIDRIRPKRGYVMGNIALLCWRCNNLKRDATPEELMRIAQWSATRRGNQS